MFVQVTPQAVAAFKAGDWRALHQELRLPWLPSLLDLAGDCPWPPGSAGEATWEPSVALHEVLHGDG